jgi:hypothetical protein
MQRPTPNLYKFEEFKMKKLFALTTFSALTFVAMFATVAAAKIPAPVLTDEAKLKAAETAAKTAWTGKVDSFLLCKYQDKSSAHYRKTAATAKPATATPPCADPGAFVFPVPEAATAAAAPAVPAASTAAAKPVAPAAQAAPAVVAAPAKKS